MPHREPVAESPNKPLEYSGDSPGLCRRQILELLKPTASESWFDGFRSQEELDTAFNVEF
jgi:hypothetical protein